jgi:hypothetical protein
MALHDGTEFPVSCSWPKPEDCVESEKSHVIAVGSRRRAGAHVPDFSAVIPALHTGSRNVLPVGNVGIEVSLVTGNVVKDPVGKATLPRRIGS